MEIQVKDQGKAYILVLIAVFFGQQLLVYLKLVCKLLVLQS